MFGADDSYGMTFRWMMQLAGDQALSRPYAQHPWVHACVSAIGKAVSNAPLVIQRPTRDGTMEPVTEGLLFDLFARPNKLMSQRKFLKSLTQTQQLYGETMLLMMTRDANGVIDYIKPEERIDVPAELWPVRGDLLEEIIDPRTQLPRAWRMQTKEGTVEVAADSLIHVAEANPYSPIRGMGPMAAAYRTAAKDFVLDRYDEALLQNSGSPGGILSVDGHLTDADQRAIGDAWRESHGRTDQHRKTAVLPQGTKYEEIGFSPQEMEFRQMRDWNRETIMSIFGVTKPIIGLTEGLNYASSLLAFRSFYEVTIIPFLDFISDEFETKFIQRLKGPESEYRVSFDLSGVAAMREDSDSKVERTLKLFREGGRTFNEAAELAGWDVGDTELEAGDIAFVSSSLTQLKLDEEGNLDKPSPPPMASPEREDEVLEEDDEPIEVEDDIEDEEERDADRVDIYTRDLRFPPSLQTSAARLKYWEEWDQSVTRHEEKLAKASKRVLRELVLQIRRRLREVSEGPWQDAPNPNGKSVRKAIATEAEIMRLLDINQAAWGEEMYRVLEPRIAALMVESAAQAHAEIGGGGMVLTTTDPLIVRYMADKKMVLVNITQNIIDEVQRGIVRVLATDPGSYSSLREAIWFTLAESEAYINTTLKGLGTRASLIARTETTGAANYGRQQQMVSDGIRSNIWLAQPSARDHHVELSGTEVQVGDEFGYGLKYPGDPSAQVSEIANCRCVLLPGTKRNTE